MPELPDVEQFRRVLRDHAVGTRVDEVEVHDTGVLRDVDAVTLRRAVGGRCFGPPLRHGKWLVVPVRWPRRHHGPGDPSLVFHFGMTGSLHWTGRAGDPPPYVRVVFTTRRGRLHYQDLRKLHGLRLARSDDAVDELLAGLGPDACTLTRPALDERLDGLRRQVKSALMDQNVVAGLGNLLVDEILWRTLVAPGRAVPDLSDADRDRLHARMRSVLRSSVRAGCVPGWPSWLTGNRDREGMPCPRCGTPLTRGRVGGRTTVWCPHCQPR